MTTTKEVPRRRIIGAVAISGRPDVADGTSYQPRHSHRRFARLGGDVELP
jgi:hypothetical protein